MSTFLYEIAQQLAAQYPTASSQQITNIIIESIESRSIISQAISYVAIPNRSQLQKAEFEAKRMPSKRVSRDQTAKREALIRHIENAQFLKQLNSFYIVPFANAGLRPVIGLDGADVSLSSGQRPDTAYQLIPPKKRPNIHGTKQMISTGPNGSTSARSDKNVYESPARNTRETVVSPLEVITDIAKRGNGILSFYDIYRIIKIIQHYPDDNQTLAKVDEVIRNDVQLRNREPGTDCVTELYRGDDLLPEELRVKRPKVLDLIGMTMQRIRAIILDQYERLQREAGQKFIKNEITYDEYVKAEAKYATYADELISVLP